MVRRVRRDVRRDDIFGDVAIRGGEVPSIFPDDALENTLRAEAKLPPLPDDAEREQMANGEDLDPADADDTEDDEAMDA